MKVGVITFHRSYNYGSALQAFALQKYLNDRHIETKLIDYVMPANFEQYRLFRFGFYKKEGVRAFVSDILYFVPRYKRKRNFEKFVQKYMPLTDKKYNRSEAMKDLNNRFEAFVCGSDQIWNPACTCGAEPAYYLDFADDDKVKISYAASIAHTEFTEAQKKDISKYLASFNAISLREGSTIPMIQDLVPLHIEEVVDPTLLLTSEDYRKIMQPVNKSDYIFVYVLEENAELEKYVVKIAQEKNLKVVYVDRKKKFSNIEAENVFGIAPDEFLSYLDNATYIVTNSFHATVFSILFEKTFCTFKTKHSFSRMVDLLSNLGLQERLYTNSFMMEKAIDWTPVNENLRQLKISSEKFLKENLY